MTILLSHMLTKGTPVYGGRPGLAVRQETSIARGDSSNTQVWSFPNHLGTHIDTPKHFFQRGEDVTSYPSSFWEFSIPQVLSIPCEPNTLVTEEHVRGSLREGVDILIIRTEFERYRSADIYWRENPGLSPDLALYLRSHHPSIRIVGIDSISISRWKDRETGRAAHRAFLDNAGMSHAILLIEDMKLADCSAKLMKVLVVPLFVEGADGSPVVVFGWNSK